MIDTSDKMQNEKAFILGAFSNFSPLLYLCPLPLDNSKY